MNSSIFGNAATASQNQQSPLTAESIIASLAAGTTPDAQSGSTGSAKKDRKPSEYWLNVGMILPGAGEDGSDLFLSMTGGGIALDDIKPSDVRGSNERWIQMQQGKNALLELVQRAAAKLEPGQRAVVPKFVCEVSRVGKPAQTADGTNPYAAAIAQAFRGE